MRKIVWFWDSSKNYRKINDEYRRIFTSLVVIFTYYNLYNTNRMLVTHLYTSRVHLKDIVKAYGNINFIIVFCYLKKIVLLEILLQTFIITRPIW